MLQNRHSPPQQEGRWLLQGEFYFPHGDWGEPALGEEIPALSSLSFPGSLTNPSLKHVSWERHRRVNASCFEGQGGYLSNFCHPKQNILMCLENKTPQLERKPHRANWFSHTEVILLHQVLATFWTCVGSAVRFQEHLLYKTDNFIRKTQIYYKKKKKNMTVRFLPTVKPYHLQITLD